MDRVRIGFVGAGFMGQVAHLANYARLIDDVELVALAEPRTEVAGAVARRYGVGSIFASADDMLGSVELDALVATQQFTRHLQIVAPLYRAGLPIFTEKALAISVNAGSDLITRLDASDTPFHMVGYHKRSDPAAVCARDMIAELRSTGRWGKLTFIRLTVAGRDWTIGSVDDVIGSVETVPSVAEDETPDPEFVRFISYYCHQINLIRYLIGQSYRPTYADDAGRVIVGEAAEGATVVLETDPWGAEEWHEQVVIGFEEGTIRLSLPAPLAPRRSGRVEFHGDFGSGRQVIVPAVPQVHAMLAQAKNFIAAVRGEIPPPCSAAQALDDLIFGDQVIALRRS